jgi:ring-1,2-phenylacetyl-CoA epoxidase subunit PaaC
MAVRNARDVYTRRQEGVSIWVVPAHRHHRLSPDEKDEFLRSGGGQGLPASDLLPGPGRRRPPVSALFTYTLRLGDDALIAAQRTAEWIAAAPQLEEDVALGNIGSTSSARPGRCSRTPGWSRAPGAARTTWRTSATSVTSSTSSCASCPTATSRTRWPGCLYFATYQHLVYDRLRASTDETLAGVAGKAVKEVAYHVDHATQWVLRLGDGTEGSHRRMQAGLDALWPYTAEYVHLRRPGP